VYFTFTLMTDDNLMTGYLFLAVMVLGHGTCSLLICEKLYLSTDLRNTVTQLKVLNSLICPDERDDMSLRLQKFDYFCPISLSTWGKVREAVLLNSKMNTLSEEKVTTLVLFYMFGAGAVYFFSVYGPVNYLNSINGQYFLIYLVIDIFFYFIPILERLYNGAEVNQYMSLLKLNLYEIQKTAKKLKYSEKAVFDMDDLNLKDISDVKVRHAVTKVGVLRQKWPEIDRDKLTKEYLKEIIQQTDVIINTMDLTRSTYSYKFLGSIECSYTMFSTLRNSVVTLAVTAFWNYTSKVSQHQT